MTTIHNDAPASTPRVPKLIVAAQWTNAQNTTLARCRFCGSLVGLTVREFNEVRVYPDACIACARCAHLLSSTLDELAADNPIDYRTLEGKYISLDADQPHEADAPAMPVPIVAAPWENMIERGAMQSQCNVCARLVGLAPPSQEMLAARPETVIICTRCYAALATIHAAQEQAG